VTPLLQETVAAQAARRPDATALVMGEWKLTYGELEERSNRLAQAPFDSIPDHGVAQLPADGQADPGPAKIIIAYE